MFECAGAAAALTQGVEVLRKGGRLGVAALHGGPVEWPASRLVEKELSIVGALGYQDEFSRVIALLAEGRIGVAPLISHRFALERIVDAFPAQRRPTAR